MSFDYASKATSAQNMLTKYGQPVTVTIVSPTPVYDPTTSTNVNPSTNYPAVGAVFDMNDREINGTLIQVGDKRIYVSSVGVPNPRIDDRVTVGGVVYRVVNPTIIAPAGTAVLYVLHVRK